jgi:hypothetical protein
LGGPAGLSDSRLQFFVLPRISDFLNQTRILLAAHPALALRRFIQASRRGGRFGGHDLNRTELLVSCGFVPVSLADQLMIFDQGKLGNFETRDWGS